MSPFEIEQFMWEAIKEGRKAVPVCMDNPPVGCVLVRNNTIVAKGHTNKPGAPHAEAMALSCLSGDASDVAAFVTLEPCSFHGRTPSCAVGLIRARIKTVYVGIVDPDPRNGGKGIAMMREAGIDVNVGILGAVIMTELQDFLGHAP